MSNKQELADIIEEKLVDKSLSGYELYNQIRSEYNKTNNKLNNKTFFEALYCLLDNGDINIISYNKEYDNKSREKKRSKQKQSFKFEGIIFSNAKLTFFDIKKMLANVEGEDPKEIRETLSKLRERFLFKWKQWKNELRAEVKETKVKEGVQKYEWHGFNFYSITVKSYLDFIKSKLQNYDSLPPEDLIYEVPDPSSVKINDKGLKIMEMKKMRNEKQDFINEIKKYSEIYKINKNAKRWHNDSLPMGKDFKGVSWDNPYEDLDGSMNLYDFLKIQNFTALGISNKTQEEIYSIFNKLIFYIQLKEENNFLKNTFAYALSDEPDSLDWFEYFTDTNDLDNVKEKLTKELDDK